MSVRSLTSTHLFVVCAVRIGCGISVDRTAEAERSAEQGRSRGDADRRHARRRNHSCVPAVKSVTRVRRGCLVAPRKRRRR
jgi:hypothetical protein